MGHHAHGNDATTEDYERAENLHYKFLESYVGRYPNFNTSLIVLTIIVMCSVNQSECKYVARRKHVMR
jgi:hypothetical protein